MNASVSFALPAADPLAMRQLQDVSAAALHTMYVPEKRLFCQRVIRVGGDLQREGLSHRYTMMTLLGLNRYKLSGGKSSFAIRDLTAGLLDDTYWLANAGDLGLLLWACAEVAPELLDECLRKTDATSALRESTDARRGSTMEIAWFLTGIAKHVLAEPSRKNAWEAVAHQCFELLLANQSRTGLFGHLAKGTSPTGWLRARIGSFADQVYPMIALSQFSKAFQVNEAMVSASACARAICALQGQLGQWWWHYDAPTGRVIQRYPVYSVHQDGMAPMALFAVSEASGCDFRAPAIKGLEWIYGRNELQQNLCDPKSGVIWRSIRFSSRARMVQQEARFLRRSGDDEASVGGLTMLHECRPYHLGWLLYAFCGNELTPRPVDTPR
jgi:hypothetical protein